MNTDNQPEPESNPAPVAATEELRNSQPGGEREAHQAKRSEVPFATALKIDGEWFIGPVRYATRSMAEVALLVLSDSLKRRKGYEDGMVVRAALTE
jgi:hypothetical protein